MRQQQMTRTARPARVHQRRRLHCPPSPPHADLADAGVLAAADRILAAIAEALDGADSVADRAGE